VSGAFAQTSTSSTSTEVAELCTMSNGSTIPCAFLEDAEKSIGPGTGIIDNKKGTEVCQYQLKLVDCFLLKEDGSPTLWYYLRPPTEPLFAALALFLSVTILGALYFFKVKRQNHEK
jgi:hypothetical protein